MYLEHSITATVNKDNTIRYKGNRYSVPIGTDKSVGSNQVTLCADNETLSIVHQVTGGHPGLISWIRYGHPAQAQRHIPNS